jgi:hypothetical protein
MYFYKKSTVAPHPICVFHAAWLCTNVDASASDTAERVTMNEQQENFAKKTRNGCHARGGLGVRPMEKIHTEILCENSQKKNLAK